MKNSHTFRKNYGVLTLVCSTRNSTGIVQAEMKDTIQKCEATGRN